MSSRWPTVKLSEIAPVTRRPVEVDASANYPELGIRSFGKGTFHKPAVSGMEVGSKRLYRIEPGDLLFSNVFAWEGAVAVASNDDAGRFGSHRFIACTVDKTRADARYLLHYLISATGIEQLQEASPGGAGRNRTLGLSKLGDIAIPLPPLAVQKFVSDKIDSVKAMIRTASALQDAIDQDIEKLLAERFQATLNGATWRPMREAAPLLRREVMIASDATYTELGVRSFFKGAFVRRTVPGEEFTWQKLFRVNSDDLIFSNIMAWEKGIALALPIHDGCVGNHRMLTCEARPDIALSTYLHHYFTTEDGFSKVYAASPGTAARNRTLTADALMAIEVPTPPISVQKQFVDLKNKLVQAAIVRAKQKTLTESLVPALASKLLGQA